MHRKVDIWDISGLVRQPKYNSPFRVMCVIFLAITMVWGILIAREVSTELQEECYHQTGSRVYREYQGEIQCFVEPYNWEAKSNE